MVNVLSLLLLLLLLLINTIKLGCGYTDTCTVIYFIPFPHVGVDTGSSLKKKLKLLSKDEYITNVSQCTKQKLKQ